VRVFIRAERPFDFQGFWVTAPDAPLPLAHSLSPSGPYVSLDCGNDHRMGLFCYIWSNSSAPVHVMALELSWGLNLQWSCGLGLQLSCGLPHNEAGGWPVAEP
jgi:hypothetical protein